MSEVWRTYEMKQKPAFILDLRLPPGSFDVNVTPDKREIFMTGVSASEVNSPLVQRATSFIQRQNPKGVEGLRLAIYAFMRHRGMGAYSTPCTIRDPG